MATDITIVELKAVAGVNQVALAALPQAPAGQSCLSYMQAEKVEFFRSTSSTFASATKVGESATGILTDPGLTTGQTYYYWALAVDPAGNVGAEYPVGTGRTAVPLSTTPGSNSITTGMLQSGAVTETKIANLAVTNAKISDLSASKLTAGTVTVTISFTSPIITGGTINGVTFTGGVFQTSASGRRVIITGSDNHIKAYDTGGAEVVRVGQATTGQAVFVATVSQAAEAMAVRNNGTGVAVSGVTTGSGIAVYGFSSGNAEGVRGYAIGSGGSSNGGYFYHGSGGALIAGMWSGAGGYAGYAQAGAFGPFTAAHDGFVRKGHDLRVGDLVIDKRVMFRNGINDVVTEVEKCAQRGDKRVCGVVASVVPFDPESLMAVLPTPAHGEAVTFIRRHLAECYDRVTFNAIGEGQMLVCGRGGDIVSGDFISSSDLPGHGEKQDDDCYRTTTVAQSREDVIFENEDDAKMIAVFYRAG